MIDHQLHYDLPKSNINKISSTNSMKLSGFNILSHFRIRTGSNKINHQDSDHFFEQLEKEIDSPDLNNSQNHPMDEIKNSNHNDFGDNQLLENDNQINPEVYLLSSQNDYIPDFESKCANQSEGSYSFQQNIDHNFEPKFEQQNFDNQNDKNLD